MNYQQIIQEITDRIEGAADCYIDVDGEGCMESAILTGLAIAEAQEAVEENAVYRWRPIEAYKKPEPGKKGFGERLLIVVDTGPGSVEDYRHAIWDGLDWCFEGGKRALELGYRVTQYMPLPPLPSEVGRYNRKTEAGNGA